VLDKVWNHWSENDNVLRWRYRLVEAGQVAVGLRGFRSARPRIKVRNVRRLVAGHSSYVSKVRLQT
jgi:hypothetical protein